MSFRAARAAAPSLSLAPDRRARSVALIILAGAIACGGGGTEPVTPPPGPPATATVISGGSQTGPVHAPLSAAIVIEVRDAAGRPVPSTPVNFIVRPGDGAVFAPVVTTGTDGRASTTWTLGDTARTDSLFIRVGTGTSLLTLATVTATGQPGAIVTFESFNQATLLVGQRLPLTALAYRMLDAYGNAVSVPPILSLTPALFTVSADSVTAPATEGTATGTLRPASGNAAALGRAFNVVAVRDLRPVALQFLTHCPLGSGFSNDAGLTIDSVAAVHRVDSLVYWRGATLPTVPVTMLDPNGGGTFYVQSAERRYIHNGTIETRTFTRTVDMKAERPDSVSVSPTYGGGLLYLVRRSSAPLRYTGSGFCGGVYQSPANPASDTLEAR